jgi:hypothetical protein
MTPKSTDPNETAVGEIVAHGRNFSHVLVRLDRGDEINAVIPKTSKLGCLFGSLVGWKVRVLFRKPPKMARIVELGRPFNSDSDPALR